MAATNPGLASSLSSLPTIPSITGENGLANNDSISSFRNLKELTAGGWGSIKKGLSSLSPSSLKEGLSNTIERLKETPVTTLAVQAIKLSGKAILALITVIIFLGATLGRFVWLMMHGREEEQGEVPALPDAGGAAIHRDPSMGGLGTSFAEETGPQPASFELGPSGEESLDVISSKKATPEGSVDGGLDPVLAAEIAAAPDGAAEELQKSALDTKSVLSGPMGPAGLPFSPTGSVIGGPTVDKKEEKEKKSGWSPLNYLARNIKWIENGTLFLSFAINMILLFHRIDVEEVEGSSGELEGENGDGEDPEPIENLYITGLSLPLYFFYFTIPGPVLNQILNWLSMGHSILSGLLLIAFVQLKVPLMTFKREKEVSRKLLFQGTWLVEEEEEELAWKDKPFWHIDRLVISSPNFPKKYWDKFVRKKAKNKFSDQVKEGTLNRLLALSKGTPEVEKMDIRYYAWLCLGVIVTNTAFLYRCLYMLASLFGVFYSPFFYAFHLIDVVLSFPMLKAIISSVTHNLSQLILTIMMTLVVVYLYSVLAFNFFRSSYVEEAEEEGDEPERKCHNMWTCFVYHFYAGLSLFGSPILYHRI